VASYDAEVIVVGGGPAGSATAAILAARGRDVLVLDRARFPREKACAEYLSPGVEDVLRRIGAAEAVAAHPHARLRGMRVHSGSSSFVLSYDDGRCSRYALGIDRPTFDRALLDHAGQQGARVYEQTQVLNATVQDGRVVGVRARAADGVRELRSRFVVAADGLYSAVARSLQLETPSHAPRRLGLVARYAGVRSMDSLGEMHVGRGFYCGLAPLSGGLVNVGLVIPLDHKPTGEPISGFFERWLGKLPGVARSLDGARRVTPVRGVGPLARTVGRVAGPGYLLVGDAAGFVDPFTGEGVYRALRGGELAASAADLALADADSIPTGYEAARRAVFGAKERVEALVQFFLRYGPLFETLVRHLGERPALAGRLAAVLGDYEPAEAAMRPGFIWSLIRP
jgi:geranylgeranyl reductase family protein